MNIVPLVPITMVRAAGWPLDQTSALKPAGSLILSSGSLSTAVASGGNGCGRRLPSCPLASGLLRSSGLKPGGDCASAVVASPIATIAAAAPSMDRLIVFIVVFLPVFIRVMAPVWPSSNPAKPQAADRSTAPCIFASDVIEARPCVNFHIGPAKPRHKAPHCSITGASMRPTAPAEPDPSYFCRNPTCYPLGPGLCCGPTN